MHIFISFPACRCYAPGCSTKIGANDYLVVRTFGTVSFTDKNGNHQKREGTVHIHFLEECLKSFFQDFEYRNITVPEETKKELKKDETNYLKSLGLSL